MPNGELVVFMFLYILLFRLSLVKRFKLIALTIWISTFNKVISKMN